MKAEPPQKRKRPEVFGQKVPSRETQATGTQNALAGKDVFSTTSRASNVQNALNSALAGKDVFSTASRASNVQSALTSALAGKDVFSTASRASNAQNALTSALAGKDVFSSVRQADAAQSAIAKALAGSNARSSVRHADTVQSAIANVLADNRLAVTKREQSPIGELARSEHSSEVASARAIPRLQRDSADLISDPADLGRVVRAARNTAGLSQQAFADLAGVGRRLVSELESGKATLEFGKVLRCCAAAGIDLFASRRHLA